MWYIIGEWWGFYTFECKWGMLSIFSGFFPETLGKKKNRLTKKWISECQRNPHSYRVGHSDRSRERCVWVCCCCLLERSPESLGQKIETSVFRSGRTWIQFVSCEKLSSILFDWSTWTGHLSCENKSNVLNCRASSESAVDGPRKLVLCFFWHVSLQIYMEKNLIWFWRWS